MTRRPTIADIGKHGRIVTPALLERGRARMRPRARERQQPGRMNKTEAAYAAVLQARLQAGEIDHYEYEGVKLRLADKTFLTPDFLVIANGGIEFHEVKGFWEDDARAKIKVAASKCWWAKFIAVQRKRGEWVVEEF
jgi:hypothetical protein